MGEHADDLIDQIWNDMFNADFDGWGEDSDMWGCTPKVCRYCGAGNLHWELLEDKWRLFQENRKIHRCATVLIDRKPIDSASKTIVFKNGSRIKYDDSGTKGWTRTKIDK